MVYTTKVTTGGEITHQQLLHEWFQITSEE
jgi:hypothetical protein